MLKSNSVIEIELYSKSLALSEEFKTARGAISEKEIIQLLFRRDGHDDFLFELALSPSIGEMPRDIRNEFSEPRIEKSLEAIESTAIRRAIGYYQGLRLSERSWPRIRALRTFDITTLSLQARPELSDQPNTLSRFKGSPENLDALIEESSDYNSRWAADFNASLSIEDWTRFCAQADLSNCIYLEQPLRTGAMTFSLKSICPVPVFADEEMTHLSARHFVDSPFDGFVLKPIRHDFDELMEWLAIGQQNQIPFLVGGQLSDKTADDFLGILNQCATWQCTFPTDSDYLLSSRGHLSVVASAYARIRNEYCLESVLILA